ncbi:unnamed protein product [Peniophora sp. CBMAI 1063]|nr:unnamed protein product [Peniophora sp. CBMAI 1063]
MSSPSTSPTISVSSAPSTPEISPISFTPSPPTSRTSSPRPKLCPLDALHCAAPRVRKATSWQGSGSTKCASGRPQVILPPIAKLAPPARASVIPAHAPAPLSPLPDSPQMSWPVYQARFRGLHGRRGSCTGGHESLSDRNSAIVFFLPPYPIFYRATLLS